MKKTFLIIFLLFSVNAFSQDSFLKEISNHFFGTGNIVATADNGWLVLAKESLQLSKYNACGDLEWSNLYDIKNESCCIGNQLIVDASGNLFLLSRQEMANDNVFRITKLDAFGTVIWSTYYEERGLNYYPYSLMTDPKGNLLVFANKSSVDSGHSTLTKIDVNGAIIWSKKYDQGGTWGDAILTEDSGVLIRRGDEFIKLDDSGVVEWSTQVVFPNTYYYLAPVEVSDGYIFTKATNGNTKLGFHKLDKQGNLMWGGGQYTAFSGNPKPLRKTANGNFVTIINKNSNTVTASSVIIEFDKDLNIVKQNGITMNTPSWVIDDITFAASSQPIIAGKVSAPNFQQLIFGKLSNNFQLGCDTIINDPFTFVSGSAINTNVNASANLLNPLNFQATQSATSLMDVLTCSNTQVKVATLAPDTVICEGSDLILENLTNSSFTNYLWSTGETSPTISVNTPGTYWLVCSSSCTPGTYSDTIVVGVTAIQNPNLPTDTTLCGENTLVLDAGIPQANYLWQDKSTAPTFLVTEQGNYYVDITVQSCVKRFESIILSCEDYIIPNIFTPNGDGINDYFEVIYYGSKSFQCEVYNRWGVVQFKTESLSTHWDGTLNGSPVSDGVYMYLIQIGNQKLKGTVTVLR